MGFFVFVTMSKLALEPTQPPIQWIPWDLTPGVKQLCLEADHSPIFGAEVKNARIYTSTPPICLHCVVLN